MVASQVRGYGVWDGALAQGGTLLEASKGHAPSLLFLWVTEAQANLLRAELCSVQVAAATSGTVDQVMFLPRPLPSDPLWRSSQVHHAASCCWCWRSSCGSSKPPCWPPFWTWMSTGVATTRLEGVPTLRWSGMTACCSSTPARPLWTTTSWACWDNSRSTLLSLPQRVPPT